MKRLVLVADLDDTLVDSRALELLRRARKWKECVARLREATAFPQMSETLRRLRRRGASIAIVTNSVSYYAEAVLRHFDLEYDALIAWHDTKLHKPNSEPVVAGLRRLRADANCALAGIGDSLDDCTAYSGAGLHTLGAGWSPTLAREASWDLIARQPAELASLLAS